MSAFTSFTGIAIFRFILGAFEASISPSMRTLRSLAERTGVDNQWSLSPCGGLDESSLFETSQ